MADEFSSDVLRGERLTALRDIEGLSQAQLAERLECSQSIVSQIAARRRPFSADLAVKASREFGLPLSFFTAEATPGLDGVPTFRKQARATVREERHVVGLFKEALRFWWNVSERSGYKEFPPSAHGSTDHQQDIESAAQQIRREEGLQEDSPVPNVTRLLERRGIAVVPNLGISKGADAADFSMSHSGISIPSSACTRPLVAINTDLPAGVARLTLGHEFAHLLFDNDRTSQITSTRAEEEKRAFQFGGALLISASVVKQRVREGLPLQGYLQLKAEYGITVGAIVMRAKTLGVITPARARSLQIQMSALGWRKLEPVPVAEESPLLLQQACKRIWPNSLEYRASEDLGVKTEWIHQWLYGSKGAPTESSLPVEASVISFGDRLASRSFQRRRA